MSMLVETRKKNGLPFTGGPVVGLAWPDKIIVSHKCVMQYLESLRCFAMLAVFKPTDAVSRGGLGTLSTLDPKCPVRPPNEAGRSNDIRRYRVVAC